VTASSSLLPEAPPRSQTILVCKFLTHRLVLAICIVVALGWVAYTSNGIQRAVWGFASIGVALALFAIIRDERETAAHSLIAQANVSASSSGFSFRGRRGYSISYRFVASNGQEYIRTCVSVNGRQVQGSTIGVVYCTYNPSKNLPLSSFIFCSIKTCIY
jgi:hypothetical protein